MTEHNVPIKRRGRKHRTDIKLAQKNIQAGPNLIKEIETANTKSVSIVAVILVVGFVAVMVLSTTLSKTFQIGLFEKAADPMYCRTDISDHSCYLTRSECVRGDIFTCKEQRAVYCAAGTYSEEFFCVDSVESGKKIGKDLDWVKTNRNELSVFCKPRKDAYICKSLYEKE